MSTRKCIVFAGTILFLLILCLPVTSQQTASGPDYSITYAITLQNDGTALWRVEYRTLLLSEQDVSDFEIYTRELPTVYIPQFRELMEKSAAQAAVATGRHMAITDVAGTSAVQTSPTGRYGVVVYSLRWEGFVKNGPLYTIGDAFAGGLYLAKDNTLIIRYPAGFAVQAAEPVPDTERDGLVWYGQRSFGAGEPRVVLELPVFPVLPVAAGLLLIIAAAFTGFYIYQRKKQGNRSDEPEPAPLPLSEAEMVSLREQIIALLTTNSGELFQSEIVRKLGLPKSTVSTALNRLQKDGTIQKVRKGRENLIRLCNHYMD